MGNALSITKYISILVGLLIANNALGQKSLESLRVVQIDTIQLEQKISYLLENPEKIESFCDSLSLQSTNAEKNLQWINEIADALIGQRQFQIAEQILNNGQQKFRKHADSINVEYFYSLYLLVKRNHFKQEYAKNIPILLRLNKLYKQYHNDYLIVKNLQSISKYALGAGNMELGLTYFKQALALAKEYNYHKIIYNLYLDLGNRMNFYEPQLGIDLLEYAAYYHDKYLAADFDLNSYYYLALGMLYLGVDLETGYNKFEESLKQFKIGKNLAGDAAFLYKQYFNYYIGYCYKMLEQFDSSLVYLDQCQHDFENNKATDNPLYGKVLNLKGVWFLVNYHPDSALHYLKSAHKFLVDSYGSDNIYHVMDNENNITKALINSQKINLALTYNNHVINTITGTDSLGLYDLYPAENLDKDAAIAYKNALIYKIELLQKLHADTKAIVKHYHELFNTFLFDAANKTKESSLFVNISEAKEYRDSMFYLACSKNLAPETRQEIWEMFANIKSFSLRTIANRTNNAVSDSTYFKLLQVQHEILELANGKESPAYEQLKNREIELKIDFFIKSLYQPDEDLKAKIPEIHFADTKSKLGATDLLLDYYLKKDTLLCYTMSQQGLHMYTTKLSPGFDKKITAIKRSIKTGGDIDEQVIAELSEILLGKLNDVLKLKDNIIIIPDGKLWELPFELLYLKNRERLIQKNNVSYLYNASHLNKKHSMVKPALLVAAPGFVSNSENPLCDITRESADFRKVLTGEKKLAPLPNTLDECKIIGKYSKKVAVPFLLLTDEKATKKMVLDTIHAYTIAHFATHGISDKRDYKKSGIFLFDGNNKNQVAYLSMDEIFTQNIKLDLIVLSACKSGCGEIFAGEGMVALPRGFIASGTKNVIASLWKVHDEKTKDLMVAFYKHLLEDKVSYAEALRLAKLDCIEKGFLPMDWAGFVLIGS